MTEWKSPEKVLKVKPPPGYPPEDGRYLRGNDYSPVAVVAILNTFDYAIPPELERIVRITIENGAALAGMLQTENIGIEKIVANIVANPNIRYLVLCAAESEGHLPGDALKALINNGVDKNKAIIGTRAPTAYVFNSTIPSIERFRSQVTLVDLVNETDAEIIKEAVQACYQEKPTQFGDYELYDLGAYPEPAICRKITWRVTEPWLER
ncbi:MAG TPA: tetrahydromethanopterin S-methyltransferase subunit A [Dehalococcoidia bacterium]|nr:tetrahydromethanopterin S-methyltransferase subunit A [Dehalococcoidia bacterium]